MQALLSSLIAKATGPNGKLDVDALLDDITRAWDDLDAKVSASSRSEDSYRRQSEEDHTLLGRVLSAMREGITVFDADDRLVLWNSRYVEFYPELEGVVKVGMPFKDMLRLGLERGAYLDGVGREEEWLRNRLDRHACDSSSEEQRRADGR